MTDVVVVGSINIDLVARVSRFPAPGETLQGENLETFPGGKGANQAVAASKLGSCVAMVGRVGHDEFGAKLLGNLRQSGVGVDFVQQDDDCTTGSAIIIIDDSGENSIITSAGANERVSRHDVDRAAELLRHARLMLLQLEIPLETVSYAIEMASKCNVGVILNPAPARAVTHQLLRQVRVLVANESEAKVLTGVDVGDVASARDAARRLLAIGVRAAIITLGGQGALMATADEVTHIHALSVDVVDTTAAGDAFIGGLAAALTRGLPLVDAVRYANCAGALAVTRRGAQPSLPNATEVNAAFALRGLPASEASALGKERGEI